MNGKSPVNATLDSLSSSGEVSGPGVDGAAHSGHSGVPGVVDFWEPVELDLNDLATLHKDVSTLEPNANQREATYSVIDVRANDETLDVALGTMADGDDVTSLL